MGKWKKKAKRNKKLAKYWCGQATHLEAQLLEQEDKFKNEIATLKAASTGDQSEYIKSLQDQINMLLEEVDDLQARLDHYEPFAFSDPLEHSSDKQELPFPVKGFVVDGTTVTKEQIEKVVREVKAKHTPEGRSEHGERSGDTKWLKTPEEIEELVKEGFVWKATDADGLVKVFQEKPETGLTYKEDWWATRNEQIAENDFSKPWKESLEYIGPKEKAPEGAPHVLRYDG